LKPPGTEDRRAVKPDESSVRRQGAKDTARN